MCCLMRAPAPRMSRMRASSLRGISHFPQHSLANVLREATLRYDIDLTAEFLLQHELDGDKVRQIRVVGQFDKDVDIAVASSGTPGDRAEHPDPADASGGQPVAEPLSGGACLDERWQCREGTRRTDRQRVERRLRPPAKAWPIRPDLRLILATSPNLSP